MKERGTRGKNKILAPAKVGTENPNTKARKDQKPRKKYLYLQDFVIFVISCL